MKQLRKLEVIFTRKFIIIPALVLFTQVLMGFSCGGRPKPADWAYLSEQSKNAWYAALNRAGLRADFRPIFGRSPISADGVLSQLGPGKFTTDFGGLDQVTTAALQPDGKIIAAGVANSYAFGLVRYNTDGTLDTTFGTGGKVTTTFFNPGGSDGQVCTSLVIQPDGKIIAVGAAAADTFAINQWDFALARYNADGSLDTTFGAGGKVLTDVQGTGMEDIALASAVQPDGKIVVAGSTSNPPPIRYNFAIVRYNSNGSLDNTFGTAGKTITDFNSDDDLASSLVIQPDGKMIAGGWTFSKSFQYSSYDFALARYDSNGNLDGSFGSGGKVVTDFAVSSPGDPRDDGITCMVLQPNGKLLVAGVGEPNRNTTSSDFVIARYNTNGSLDTAFGAGGKVITDFNESADMANSTALQPDGKFIVAGVANGTLVSQFRAYLQVVYIHADTTRASDFAIARYNPNGSLDSSFGTGGKGTTDFFGSVDAATKVLIRPDGNILALGFAQTTPFFFAQFQSNFDFAGVLYFGKYLQRRKLNDFDGDGIAEFGVFRPSNATWYLMNSFSNTSRTVSFGMGTDKPVVDDYDGDGHADIAVFRNGSWNILQSSDSATRVLVLGQAGDIPVRDDYDGDGKTDIAVWRPSNGTWYWQNSGNGQSGQLQFGQAGDIPVNGDYDGDGKSDISYFHPADGTWHRINSSNGANVTIQFGANGDKPVVGDYDGDGIFDFAVFRPSDQTWNIRRSSDGTSSTTQFGLATDIPIPADYDGDQLTDIAVFRPSDGTWQGLKSSGGTFNVQFGASGDIPVPSVDVPATVLVSISGRVLTPDSSGLRNARVIITDSNGLARAVLTNSFGNYQFLSVQSGMTYTIGVASKRFRFSSRALPVADTLTNVDFVGIE